VYEQPVELILSTGWPPTENATIRYTLDGTIPTQEHGQVYSEPIRLEQSGAIAAVAFKAGLANSPVRSAVYAIGISNEEQPLVKSYHIGNSLTDNATKRLAQVCWSMGRNYRCLRKTIPGCSIRHNWDNNAQGFAFAKGENDYQQTLAAGVNHLFLQPFPNPPGLKTDGEYGARFIRLAREGNADVQPWLYAQWAARSRPDAHCTGWRWGDQPWSPDDPNPETWEDWMANKQQYYRELLAIWNREAPGKRKVRMAPCGTALVNLKQEIDEGNVPGMTDLFVATFSDAVHLNPKGDYLLACVQYACMFGESPVGKANAAGTGLTPEQARIFERIAWETVLADPESGVTF
jgi:hypothetical protein